MPAPLEVCQLLAAMTLWWQISLDPERRLRDAEFAHTVDQAISGAAAWTRREPHRAEAWFYLGTDLSLV